MERDVKQYRSVNMNEFETRDADNGDKHITGYFAVFDSVYQFDKNMSESIREGAFTNLSGDIRALINHDDTLVLGRTTAHTLELRQDSHGLWGDILINPNDSDAMNLYARVQRGDVTQCSIGFNILSEETEFRDDGSVHWTITEIQLFEVSPCTFPAYEETGIQARKRDYELIKAKKLDAWKTSMRSRLKGE